MSKRDKFKDLAQAAFEPTASKSPVSKHPIPGELRLHDTERIKGARLIPIDRITPDPTQPRKHFPEKSIQELAASIVQHGVIQPLTVSCAGSSDVFTIITGERRYRAAYRAGLTHLPCIVLDDLREQERFYHQLVENLHREDIAPFEEAEAFRLLAEKFRLKHIDIAQIVAKSRSYVTKTMSLARIPESVRSLCNQRKIASREHLIIVARQKTESAMLDFLNKLAHENSSVQTLRKVARGATSRHGKRRPFEFFHKTPGCTVRVRFTKKKASKQEIVDALMKALRSLDGR
jgi:ParB family transcriptional regulator, chromosome partitioning protein